MRLVYVNQAEKPFRAFIEHTHSFWEIILVTEGLGVYTVGDRHIEASAGTIICVPPGVRHGTASEGGLKDCCAAYEDVVPATGSETIILRDSEQGDIRHLLDMLYRTVRHTPPNARHLTEALNMTLWELLGSMAASDEQDNRAVVRLKASLMDGMADPEFDIGRAMDETGFSRGYLRRLFRESEGEPPIAWLNRRRIEQAASYLRQYDNLYTIQQIGTMVGVPDVCRFSKLFRRYKGLSPRAYAKIRRLEPAGEMIDPEKYLDDSMFHPQA